MQSFFDNFSPCLHTFPEKPRPESILFKICERLGLEPHRKWRPRMIASVYCVDATYRPAIKNAKAINARCVDISKTRVSDLFERCFGYPLAVDPATYVGLCVRKSEENAAHDGVVIACPVDEVPGQTSGGLDPAGLRAGRAVFRESHRMPREIAADYPGYQIFRGSSGDRL